MEIDLHADSSSFLASAASFLERTESENNLLIAILGRVPPTLPPGETAPLLITASENGEVVSALICLPPWGPIITDATPDVIEEMVRRVVEAGLTPPAVVGPRASSHRFATIWARHTGQRIEIETEMRSFILRDLLGEPGTGPTGTPLTGRLIRAREADEDLATMWGEAFSKEILHDPPETPRKQVRRMMDSESLFIWVDPEPVSMLAIGGRTPHGGRVSMVYTPPAHRGRGYAFASVRELSRRLLDEGCRYCFLFTDAANPTSNHIYQLVGYQHIGDFVSYRFIA